MTTNPDFLEIRPKYKEGSRRFHLLFRFPTEFLDIPDFVMKKPIAQHIHWRQRGFPFSRQMKDNTVDINGFSQIAGMSFRNTWLVLFDIASAFPAAYHDWLFLMLRTRGCPEGFINLLEGLCFIGMAFYRADGAMIFLYMR